MPRRTVRVLSGTLLSASLLLAGSAASLAALSPQAHAGQDSDPAVDVRPVLTEPPSKPQGSTPADATEKDRPVAGTKTSHESTASGGRLEVFPSTAAPGTTVTVSTTGCGTHAKAEGDASTVGGGRFKLTAGTHKELVVGQFTVGREARSGTHRIRVTCQDGKSMHGDLSVADQGPKGHVQTGVGGGASSSPDPTKIAAGAAFLAVSAVGGIRLLRRRASGTR
ncbi:hypothetical protein [Streptomyces sp. NPDC006879]|uniref:hypothetical protein n=1 Tax=Streptomyces sp. NPDC006879 TaxID=3364767 RepID=UPI0036772459